MNLVRHFFVTKGAVSEKNSPRLCDALRAFLLFFVYFLTGHIGLQIGAVSGFATLVWPPSAIAMVSLYFLGSRFWPAVALAAFSTNYFTGAPWYSALGIATGNTLEAVLSVYLLRRAKFQPSFDRIQDAFTFILCSAIGSTWVSALIGVMSLWVAGKVPGAEVPVTFKAWWLGDMVADLVLAPFIFVMWSYKFNFRGLSKSLEALALGFATILTCAGIFPGLPLPKLMMLEEAYFVFPSMLWAAVRFNQVGAVVSLLAVAVLSVWGTTMGTGPFASEPLSAGLIQLQTFMCVISVTALFLTSAIGERVLSEKALKVALEQRDEFLSVASHELRTPVTSLMLQLQLLQTQAQYSSQGGNFSGQLNRSLRNLEKSIGQLSALLETLLDVTRIRVGQFKLVRRSFDLAAAIRDIAAKFSEDALQAGAPIILRLPDSMRGEWDPLRIEQVITNLISNAIKYGNGKPITITLQSDPGQKRVILAVVDQGLGIEADMLPRLFKRFERASEGSLIHGLGLGLYITRQIVEAHGGTIQVKSEARRGSEFIVSLPIESGAR